MIIAQVVHFNREVLGIEQREPGMPELKEVSHLIKCLLEEVEEYRQAYEYGDYIGMIDSLCDSIYFAVGGLYKLGLPPDVIQTVFTAVHERNMRKKKGTVGRRDTGAADAVKPDGWVPPEERIAKILDDYQAGKVFE